MMDDGHPIVTGPPISWFSTFLDEDDNPELWQVALDHILAEFETVSDVLVEVGRCLHWLRPHQSRWTAGGGFAWPTG
jgi:hypothetical protein